MDIFERVDAWSGKLDALRRKIGAMEHKKLMTSGREINQEIDDLKEEMRRILEDIEA